MTGKVIQEQFGQAIIDAMAAFAKKDIKTVAELEADEFSHVSAPAMRAALAETLYGARWLYKIGLAMLASNQEQSPHVRAQIIDYASVSEALLADIIVQAYKKGLLTGPTWQRKVHWQTTPLAWNPTNPEITVGKTTFEWRIMVAHESRIIDDFLRSELNSIRTRRNTVHLTAKINEGVSYYAGMAKRSLTAMHKTIDQTKDWVAAHP